MKTFEQFVNENNSHIGRTTSWSDKHKRKNVTLSLKDVNNYLNQQNTPIEFIDPKSVEHLLIKVERDSERVENANLDFPIIVVKKDNKFTKILDGQHRVFKCLQNNINKIKCKILNLDNAPIKYRYLFEQFVNENIENLDSLYKIAKNFDYDTFLDKTDSLTNIYNILYRGCSFSDDEDLFDDVFMTDYIGHAREYGDNVNGIIYDQNEVLYFNNGVFNNLKKECNTLTKQELKNIYSPYINSGKLSDAMEKYDSEKLVVKFVYDFIHSDIPYSKIQQTKNNDLLIPIMQYYAKSKDKNILSFLGGDYFDYGGADEFVVNDISKYVTLKDIWNKVNKKNI